MWRGKLAAIFGGISLGISGLVALISFLSNKRDMEKAIAGARTSFILLLIILLVIFGVIYGIVMIVSAFVDAYNKRHPKKVLTPLEPLESLQEEIDLLFAGRYQKYYDIMVKNDEANDFLVDVRYFLEHYSPERHSREYYAVDRIRQAYEQFNYWACIAAKTERRKMAAKIEREQADKEAKKYGSRRYNSPLKKSMAEAESEVAYSMYQAQSERLNKEVYVMNEYYVEIVGEVFYLVPELLPCFRKYEELTGEPYPFEFEE